MSARSRRIWAPVAAMALALTLGACGGGGGSGPDGGGDGDGLTYEDSPLSKYFAAAGGGEDFNEEEAQAEAEAMNAEVEQAVATCMAEEGFEYTPMDTSGMISLAEQGEDFDPIENARQNGYGMFTFDDSVEADPDAEEFVDPNQAYLESMSESEQAAYYEALNGASVEYDEDAEMETDWNWEEQGCYGEAQHEVFENGDSEMSAMNAVYSDPQWSELMTELGELYTQAQSDPRMVEIDGEWATCMADAGHPDIANPMAAAESIYTLSNDLWAEHADDPEYMGPEGQELEDLKKQEIDLAVADFTCQEEVSYTDEQFRVQFAIEQEYIDANKSELEAFSEALASAAE